MKTGIYSVFDSKIGAFSLPWFSPRDASAVRQFADAVNDGSNPNNQWHKHPEDFVLFCVGEFDDETGTLVPVNPRSLVMAASLVNGSVGEVVAGR